jgi:hypothetical protein
MWKVGRFGALKKSNFPSFIQHKKWQSPIFRIYSNHKILQSLFSKLFRHQNKGNNKITELLAILQRESQNSYKQSI